MNFEDADSKFPRFKNYVTYDIPKLALPDKDGKHNAAFNALVKWAKITSEQATQLMTPGKNPSILLAAVSAKEALHEFPHKVSVPPSLVESYEKNDHSGTVLTNNGNRIYKVGLFLLEAIVAGSLSNFSTDKKDSGMSRVNKAIGGFEQEAYGGIKDRVFVP